MPEAPGPHITAWRNFKRMQLSASMFGVLVYALAVVHAYEVLPGEPRLKAFVFLLAPAAFFSMTLAAVFVAGPLRRWLKRYVWMTFAAGFGQTPLSVVVGLGILAVAAGVIFYQIATHEEGGLYPAGIFSAYAAGVALLVAQTVLCRALERDPDVRPLIEDR